MSTIKVTNIQATGETVSRAVSGVAAAWVNFNGTGTIATRDSVNVASLTDQGTGAYDINFTNNMANDDFTTSGQTNASSSTANFSSSNFAAMGNAYPPMTGQTTSNTSAASYIAGSGYADAALCYAIVHGDLA